VTTTPSSIPAAPASTEQVQKDLADARVAAKKIRRAASYATFDAWTVGIFGGLSFIFGLISGASGVVLGMAMLCISFVEFKAVTRIRRLDPTAAKTLAYNQLAFAASLIVYGLWCIYGVSKSPGATSTLSAQLGSNADLLGGDLDSMMRNLWYAVYGIVILVAVFGMGGTALYYLSREKHIRQYIQNTAPWVVEMQRSGGPL
jgi:hypothetical protein